MHIVETVHHALCTVHHTVQCTILQLYSQYTILQLYSQYTVYNYIHNTQLITPKLNQVTTVRETEEIPNNLRVHPCHWNECHMSCETAETLHKHILAQHSTVYVFIGIIIIWLLCFHWDGNQL